MKRYLVQFSVLCVVACVLVAAGGYVLAIRLADHVEKKAAEQYVERVARGLVAPSVHDRSGELALRRVDQLDLEVRERKDLGAILRVKIWAADGTVLYSDERRYTGETYPLDAEQRALLREGGTHVERTTLGNEENEFDLGLMATGEGVIEIYTVLEAGQARGLLEVYLPATGFEEKPMAAFLVPLVLLGPLVLVILVLPLGLKVLRRLHRADGRRARIMEGAMEATETERNRIARLLHDVVIPQLAGTRLSVTSVARAHDLADDQREALGEASQGLSDSLGSLRTLLDDLHEPAANPEAFTRSIVELAAPLESDGVRVAVHVLDPAQFGPSGRRLAHAVIREALRNVARHAAATRVEVSARVDVRGDEPVVLVRVADNGQGFTAGQADKPGHHGLRLLDDAVRREGGSLEVDSVPGGGTVLVVRIPLRGRSPLPGPRTAGPATVSVKVDDFRRAARGMGRANSASSTDTVDSAGSPV